MKTINKILVIGLVLYISSSMGCIDQEPQPIYKDVLILTLVDTGFSNECYIIKDVYDFKASRTGKDVWGSTEYIIDVYYYVGAERVLSTNNCNAYKAHTQYQNINKITAGNVYRIKISGGRHN